jgi:hypothetical protein
MAKPNPIPERPNIEQKVSQILDQGQITVSEHLELVNLFLCDALVTDQERFYLNRVFDELKLGHLTVQS